MESVSVYFTQIISIVNNNAWIIHEDIVFREIEKMKHILREYFISTAGMHYISLNM